MPGSRHPPLTRPFLGRGSEFSWYGEDQVILIPPSIETESLESWQWLRPPWETPPQDPGRPVADFLQQHLTREPQPRSEVGLSWQEVYCLISPFEPLLQAFGALCTSMESYYQGILAAAAKVGLYSPEELLSVLWHAPRGNAWQHPERLGYLQQLVTQAHVQPNPAPYKAVPQCFLSQRQAQVASTGEGYSDFLFRSQDQGRFKKNLTPADRCNRKAG